jgi:putative ABC transport system permease protein
MFGFTYHPNSKDFSTEGAITLKVAGILTTKDNVNYGSIKTGVYYTEALTNHMLETNKDSKIVEFLMDETKSAVLASTYYNIPYTYTYRGWEAESDSPAMGTVGPAITMEDMMGSMGGGGTEIDAEDMRVRFIRTLGGNTLANAISIYPNSFDEKNLVTRYLDAWNEDTENEERADINYTDNLELVISMVNTMIDIVTYALTAFTSVSLVVSTIMIGIITYVSVVERIKEIGVIRSLGGRKKDVSHLFNAETFIIGALAGLLGIGVTYAISLVVNMILEPLIGYSSIAALPIDQAILLVALSVGLTLVSGLIPASSAAKKDPVVALRTE